MTDIVIIGGGPAGVTAGVVLQKNGYQTCIVDWDIFPREKLCAGVVTKKAVKLLHHIYKGLNLNDLDTNYINKVNIFYKNTPIGSYTLENGYCVVNRVIFDNALVEYYKNLGGRLLDGEKSYQIYYDKNILKLSDGTEIEYRFLVGADGINSRVRKHVQRGWKSTILCFEKFIPSEHKEKAINIYFGKMVGGYCWRIPGKDRIGIGLGEFYVRRMKRDVKKYLNFYHEQGVQDLTGIKGAFVSSGYYVKKPVKDNVLLVGDAAGLVDAMSGEGIFFAVESGRQAALAIIDCMQKDVPLTAYKKRIRRIHERMKEQSKFNKLLYVPGLQRMCMNYIKDNPHYTQAILEDTMSSYKTGYLKELVRSMFFKREQNEGTE